MTDTPDRAHPPEAHRPAVHKKADAHFPGHNTSSTEASTNLLAAVNASIGRNGADIATNQTWVPKDGKGLRTAGSTADLALSMNAALDPEHPKLKFSDPAFKKQAGTMISQLRGGRDGLIDEAKSAQSFYGDKGLSKLGQRAVDHDVNDIFQAARKLGRSVDPKHPENPENPEQTKKLLDKIQTSAQHLNGALGKGDPKSSDVRDMKSDTDMVLKTVAALRSSDLSPAERKTMYQSIASKAGSLIPNELTDLKLEGKEVKDNTTTVKDQEKLEAQLRYATAHPGAQKAIGQVRDTLDTVAGDLYKVAANRSKDQRLEGKCTADDTVDQKINKDMQAILQRHPVLHFTDVYGGKK